MTYKDCIRYMYDSLPMYHRVGVQAYKNNLDNTRMLDSYFGNPHKHYHTVHVAGTNGKGSVSHMLASVLQKAGYTTGLYTSPHLKDFRERIRINGRMIPRDYITSFLNQNLKIFEEIKPSFFEMTVAMAFKYFSDKKTDIAVIETGLGGRLDSTNIIDPLVSVITNISFDHMALLGDTLEKIAYEKAGIIKKNIPVVIGETSDQTMDVFYTRARELNSDIYFADKDIIVAQKGILKNGHAGYSVTRLNSESFDLVSDLAGIYQVHNIATLIKTIDILREQGIKINKNDLRSGLSDVKGLTGLRGRWEIIGKNPMIICDTGHNKAGVTYTMQELKKLPHSKLHMIIGMVNDKDIDGILELLPRDAIYYFTKAKIPRALDENILAIQAGNHGLKGTKYTTVKRALNAARRSAGKDDIIYAGGSTFVVAEAV